MTQEVWKAIDAALSGPFGQVHLRADGMQASVYRRVAKDHLILEVFVNGRIDGKWTEVEDGRPLYPEGRWWNPRRVKLMSSKELRVAQKLYSKKQIKAMLTPKVLMVDPTYQTVRTLVSHLKREFGRVEILTDEEIDAVMAQRARAEAESSLPCP